MRWMVDIDALIDGATAQILPGDVKSRAVLRIALAQLLVLKSPGHAVVSTALPLVDGGPRRLVHAILSRAQQRSEERRVGKACVSTCRSRWVPHHSKKNQTEPSHAPLIATNHTQPN